MASEAAEGAPPADAPPLNNMEQDALIQAQEEALRDE